MTGVYSFLKIPVFLQLEWFAELLECSFNFGLIGLIFFWKSCTEPEISKIVGCLQIYLKSSKELRCGESLKLCHTCQVQICRPHSLLPWGWAPQVGWLEMPGGDGEEDSSCQKTTLQHQSLEYCGYCQTAEDGIKWDELWLLVSQRPTGLFIGSSPFYYLI